MIKRFLNLAIFGIIAYFISPNGFAQGCQSINITFEADIPSTCATMTMTMIHDNLGRPFLYVANKEDGLMIFDISMVSSPLVTGHIPTSDFDSLEVMNLTQDGNYIFLAIGNHFNNLQKSGMAIVDVSNPSSPVVTDFWELPSSTGGAGIVKVEGNYAYLGAMGNGLVILDISDKQNITYVSTFLPDINYPTPSPNPSLYNARGMEVRNNIVFLCFDAGGIRIINTTNKLNPTETGRYSNPSMNGLARAYNNVILDDTLLYIAVDYCGLEIVNIADTQNIHQVGTWNPYGCPTNNWFSSPVHANEIQYNSSCHLLFISTGKSDLHVIDISNPLLPDSCNYFGGIGNNIGTWGVGLYEDQIYLSYVCSVIPFSSNWTGVKILTYDPNACVNGIKELKKENFKLYPSPVVDELIIESNESLPFISSVNIINSIGKIIPTKISFSKSQLQIDTSELNAGIYFLRIDNSVSSEYFRFVKL